jgi:hypothetical protein
MSGLTIAWRIRGQGTEEAAALDGDAGVDRVVCGEPHRHHRGGRLILDRRGPERLATLAPGVQDDFRDLRPEHRPSVVEKRD